MNPHKHEDTPQPTNAVQTVTELYIGTFQRLLHILFSGDRQ